MKKYFELMSDHVPINIGEDYSFICPLPKGYKNALYDIKNIKESIRLTTIMLNSLAQEEVGSMANIKIEGLKMPAFIEKTEINKNGLTSIFVGELIYNGIVSLKFSEKNCDDCIKKISYLFEDGVSFQCNVSYYWQALLCRELTIEYFNILQKVLNTKED